MGQEKRKDRKSQKSRSEKNVVGFSSDSLFPARKRKLVTQGGTVRAGRTSGTAGAFQIHSNKTITT